MTMLNSDIDLAKNEATHKLLSNTYSQTLTISSSDFQSGKARYQGDRELYYEGKLYDIADRVQQGESITLRIVRDEKEEGLIERLKDKFETLFDASNSNTEHRPIVKQSELTKDFLPITKISFLFTTSTQLIFCEENNGSYTFPLLQMLKSPPQIG